MKSYGKERSRGRHSKCLIVDGYNIIARLKRRALSEVSDLEAVRDSLITMLAEYRSFSGEHVIVVFDAHSTKETAVQSEHLGVQVVYTFKLETADERIERLVYDLRDTYKQITVATSDYLEQQVTFGGGALRISADEMVRRLRETTRMIRDRLDEHGRRDAAPRLGDVVRQDIAKILEKWRRE